MPLPSYPGEPAQPDRPADSGQPEPTRPIEPPAPPAMPPAPPALPTPPPPVPPAVPAGQGFPPPPPGSYPPPAYQAYYGAPEVAGRSWSATAIASFVCSLTCCLGIPAVVLGVIGIVKTSGGKAKGMWMAITGLILGLLGTLLIAAIALGLSQVEGWDDAATMDPGQCFNSKSAVSDDAETIGLVDKVTCHAPHDAEIVSQWTVDSQEEADLIEDADPWETCLKHADAALVSGIETNADPALAINFLTWDPAHITPGDDITCFVYRDGGKLTAPLSASPEDSPADNPVAG